MSVCCASGEEQLKIQFYIRTMHIIKKEIVQTFKASKSNAPILLNFHTILGKLWQLLRYALVGNEVDEKANKLESNCVVFEHTRGFDKRILVSELYLGYFFLKK